MDWNVWGAAIFAAAAAALGSWGANRFFMGELSQSVRGNSEDILELKADRNAHRTTLDNHGQRISSVEGQLLGRRPNGSAL